MRRLGVAVVGAAPEHWSAVAHIPAIRASEHLVLARLVTSSRESAAAAERRWGVPATDDLSEALADDEVDIVTVTLRVPRHAEVVRAAVDAGKHVYCEWPLAVDRAEAAELAALSGRRPDLVLVTGLQGRWSPLLRAAASLVAGGRLGRPLTASLRVFVPLALVPRPAHRAHLRHSSTAANVLTIQAGHALDMLGQVLGPATVLAARLWCAAPEFKVLETGERLLRDAPDNLIAMLAYRDVVASTQFSQTGSLPLFCLEILGDRAALRLTGRGQPESTRLSLSLSDVGGSVQQVDSPGDPANGLSPDEPAFNVALGYAQLTDAIRTGRSHPALPDFSAAASLHALLADISAAGG